MKIIGYVANLALAIRFLLLILLIFVYLIIFLGGQKYCNFVYMFI